MIFRLIFFCSQLLVKGYLDMFDAFEWWIFVLYRPMGLFKPIIDNLETNQST